MLLVGSTILHESVHYGDDQDGIDYTAGHGEEGQAFEDVTVFDAILEKQNNKNIDWHSIFDEFFEQRKPNTDAIATLALDNFMEMQNHTATEDFQLKRKVELSLEHHFPKQYFSKYSLVTFQDNVSYHKALKKGRKQDEIILNLIQNNEIGANVDLNNKNEINALLHKIIAKIV